MNMGIEDGFIIDRSMTGDRTDVRRDDVPVDPELAAQLKGLTHKSIAAVGLDFPVKREPDLVANEIVERCRELDDDLKPDADVDEIKSFLRTLAGFIEEVSRDNDTLTIIQRGKGRKAYSTAEGYNPSEDDAASAERKRERVDFIVNAFVNKLYHKIVYASLWYRLLVMGVFPVPISPYELSELGISIRPDCNDLFSGIPVNIGLSLASKLKSLQIEGQYPFSGDKGVIIEIIEVEESHGLLFNITRTKPQKAEN